jgi:hypothetical protein
MTAGQKTFGRILKGKVRAVLNGVPGQGDDVRKMAHKFYDVGFEVLTAVVMKSSIFWNIMSYSPLKVNRRFLRTCRLHFQGRNMEQVASRALAWLILRPWRWRRHVPPKCPLTFSRLHDVMYQKIEFFKSLRSCIFDSWEILKSLKKWLEFRSRVSSDFVCTERVGFWHIFQVPSSNLGLDMDYADWRFSWFCQLL